MANQITMPAGNTKQPLPLIKQNQFDDIQRAINVVILATGIITDEMVKEPSYINLEKVANFSNSLKINAEKLAILTINTPLKSDGELMSLTAKQLLQAVTQSEINPKDIIYLCSDISQQLANMAIALVVRG